MFDWKNNERVKGMSRYFETKDLANELEFGELAILIQPLDGCEWEAGTEIISLKCTEDNVVRYNIVESWSGLVLLDSVRFENYHHFNGVWQKADFENMNENMNAYDSKTKSGFTYMFSLEVSQYIQLGIENRMTKELKEMMGVTGNETHKELYELFFTDYFLVKDIYLDENSSRRRNITE